MTISCMKISYLWWITKLGTTVSFRHLLDMSSWYSIPTCLSHSPPTSASYNPTWAKPGNYVPSPLEIQLASTREGLLQHWKAEGKRLLRAGRCLWQGAFMGFSSAVGHRRGAPHFKAVPTPGLWCWDFLGSSQALRHPCKSTPLGAGDGRGHRDLLLPQFPKAAPFSPYPRLPHSLIIYC